MTAFYPGSFDPITLGHIDIIRRAARIFDKVIVGVLNNQSKSPLFSTDERVRLIEESINDIDNIEVMSFDGLLVDFMRENGIEVIIKGLRAVSDFEYEFQMAQMNKSLCKDAETMFMMTSPEYSYLSSSIVREVARFGGNVDDYVTETVRKALTSKFEGVSK